MKQAKVHDIVVLRAKRKLAEVQHSLVPEHSDLLAPMALAERVAQQLKALPPERRTLLCARVGWAVLDLNVLASMLSSHLAGIRDELVKLNGHRAATAAYGRARPARRRHWSGGR